MKDRKRQHNQEFCRIMRGKNKEENDQEMKNGRNQRKNQSEK